MPLDAVAVVRRKLVVDVVVPITQRDDCCDRMVMGMHPYQSPQRRPAIAAGKNHPMPGARTTSLSCCHPTTWSFLMSEMSTRLSFWGSSRIIYKI